MRIFDGYGASVEKAGSFKNSRGIEGAGNALVIMETRLRFPGDDGIPVETTRRATYVFRQEDNGRWLCTIDNSYGTELLG